jgi:hypothetical protein
LSGDAAGYDIHFKEQHMKFKLGKKNEWVIFGENDDGTFNMGIHFACEISKKKTKELQKLLNLALSDFQL